MMESKEILNIPQLHKANIFAIEAGDYFNKPISDLLMVYSPFADSVMIATPAFVKSMEDYMDNNRSSGNPDLNEVMASLLDFGPIENYIARLDSPDSFARLPVLPNNVCNFSCSYCYSAKGRSGEVISWEKLKTALDSFITKERLKGKTVFIPFLGGGEPLLSWDLVKTAIEYASELCQKAGSKSDFSLVTNGSVLTPEMIETFKKYKVVVSVSFEILEDIQNLQRGHYPLVARTIGQLVDEGIYVKVRSTITSHNVLRQKEMVQTMIARFPAVKDIMMEAVTDDKSFESIKETRQFYNDYLINFFEAFQLGDRHGKNVECSASRNIDLLIERFCPGEFSITPDGKISMCTRISSPYDPGYNDSIYGEIGENGFIIDRQKFNMLAADNVYRYEKCTDCFAKWHCGGGCMAQKYIYSPEILDVICDYTREFTRRILLFRLNKNYINDYGISLKESVQQMMV